MALMAFLKSKQKRKQKTLKKGWFLHFFPLEFFDGLKRQQLISLGSLLSIILVFSPVIIWLMYMPSSLKNPLIGLAKFNAFMAISTLSINFFISARLKALEYLFNGLDRMYRVHKVIGRSSLFFMLLHPLFLIIASNKNTEELIQFVVPVGSIDVSAGVIAVYVFLLLICLTVAVRIPYHWWHNSHKLLGIVLFLAGFHAVAAGSDIARFSVLRFWVIFLITLGLVSWIYMTFFYKVLGPRYKVSLHRVDHFTDVTEIYFKKPAGFSFQPGQFLFIRFPRFEGNKELFPFSISSDASQKMIRLSISRSGDYTSEKVPLLKKGDTAIVMGPYGQFGNRYLKHNKDMVWIAGGIGITPFLSLAKHESIHPTGRKILLLWAQKNKKDVFHNKELNLETKRNTNFQYVSWISDKKGRVNGVDILHLVGGKDELKNRIIFMCGPPPMMYSLSKEFHRMGISFHQIIFEDFNMLD